MIRRTTKWACTGASGSGSERLPAALATTSAARRSRVQPACGAGCSGEGERDGGPAAAHPAPGLHLHRGRVQHVPLLHRPAGQALLRQHRSVLPSTLEFALKIECPVTGRKFGSLSLMTMSPLGLS